MIIYRNKSIQSFSKNVKLMSVAVGATLISTAVAAAIHTSITKGENAEANNYGIAAGYNANAGVQAIAVGRLAKASNNFSAAIGDTAEAKGISSYAFGRNTYTNNWANAFGAQAKGEISTAIGWDAEANGLRSQAIGAQAKVYGDRSLSVGHDVQTHKEYSFSIGSNVVNKGTKTTVIGRNIDVSTDNSVFLGDSSAYTAPSNTSGGIGKVTGDYAGVEAKGVVSVGSKGNERRIQNVAAGLVSKTSTDAINGS